MTLRPTDKLVINRESDISIKDQVVTQLMIRITSGQIAAGDKLPSIRQLARQLGIHYNSCLAIYQRLEDMGLVERQQGSSTRVRQLPDKPNSPQPNHPFEFLIESLIHQANQQGVGVDDIVMLLKTQWQQSMAKTQQAPLIYIDRMPDILPLFQHELETHLKKPVRTCVLDTLEQRSTPNPYTHWITSTYYGHRVQLLLEKQTIFGTLTIVPTNPAANIREKILKLPKKALVVVVSVSTVVLQQAEAVIKALRGNDLLISLRLNNELTPHETKSLFHQAKLILGDSITSQELTQRTQRRIDCIPVMPPDALNRIDFPEN